MSLSSGNRTAIGEAASWLFAGACVIASIIYFDELKAILSPLPHGHQSAVTVGAGGRGAMHDGHRRATIAEEPSSGHVVRLEAGQSGHFETTAYVNGRAIKVLVDTGATYVGLTYEDAERVGIFVSPSDFNYTVQTANGDTQIAVVDIDRLAIGDIEVRNVKATVGQPGKLHVTLLGMSFLSKLRRAEMRSGQLILEN